MQRGPDPAVQLGLGVFTLTLIVAHRASLLDLFRLEAE